MQPITENLRITKLATRKNLGPTKYPQEKFWTNVIPIRKNYAPTKYQREKFSIYEIPTKKNFGPTKYTTQEKISDQRNTHEGIMSRWHDGTKPTIACDP